MPYDDVIRRVSEKHGVDPSLLWGVVKTESNFNPNAVSKAGAIGLGQLMPATAAQYGVDPHDPEQNLEGAAQHLAYLTKRFNGDTQKALAAYNAGEGRVGRGGPLPAETRAYVPKVLSNAKGYQPEGGNVTDDELRAAFDRAGEEDAIRAAFDKHVAPFTTGQPREKFMLQREQRPVSYGAVAGSVVGGVAGSIAGGPAGGMVGATAGAAVGELAQQQYDRMTGSIHAPQTAEEAGNRVAMETAFGAAGEFVGAGIRLLKPVMYAKPRQLTPDQQQTKAVLDQHRIPYTPNEITGNIFHNFSKSLADSGILSQGTMQKFVRDRNVAIRDAVTGVANEMGRQVPPDVLGQQVIKHIRNEDETISRTVIEPLYNQIAEDLKYVEKTIKVPSGKMIPSSSGILDASGNPTMVPEVIDKTVTEGGLLVDQSPVKKLFAKEVADIERTARLEKRQDLLQSAHYLSMKRFVGMPDQGQWTDLHSVLKETRKALRDLDNPLNTATEVLQDKSVLTRAEKAIEQQLQTALETSADPAHQLDRDLWKQAQTAVRAKNEKLRNEVTLRFIKAIEEHGGEKGMKQFVTTMTPDDMTKVMTATSNDPALQGSLRNTYLLTKLEQVGGLEDSDKLINADKLREAIFGRTGMDRRKAEIMFTPQQYRKVKEFVNAVSDVQNAPGSMLGKFLMLKNGGAVFSIPTAAVGALGYVAGSNASQGDLSDAALAAGGAISILLTPKLLAGMMTDPRKAEFMIQGLRYSATSNQAVRVTRELIRLDQGFARAVQSALSSQDKTIEAAATGDLSIRDRASQLMETLPSQFSLGSVQP